MKILKSYLALYFIFGALYFLSTLIDWVVVSYFAKPLFIGAISFYYIEQCKKPINYYNFTILLLLFLSGVINLLEGYSYFMYVLFFNFLAYSMLIYKLIKELRQKKIYKMEKENYFSIFLTSLFSICLLYISSFIVFDRSSEFYKVILVYGFVSICLLLCSTYLYLARLNQKNTYLIIYALSTLVCENFYGIYHYYYKLSFFRFTSIACYIVSFYFLVHYFLKENDSETEV